MTGCNVDYKYDFKTNILAHEKNKQKIDYRLNI